MWPIFSPAVTKIEGSVDRYWQLLSLCKETNLICYQTQEIANCNMEDWRFSYTNEAKWCLPLLLPFLFFLQVKFTALHLWIFVVVAVLIRVFVNKTVKKGVAVLIRVFVNKTVKKESVVILTEIGVQLETQYTSGETVRRFIPTSKILKPVLNECVTPVGCYWSLSLIIRGEEELILVFKDLQPP